MFKIRSLSSWAGIFFILLLLFSLWYFLLRSERASGEVLLPQKACAKENSRQENAVGQWQLFYYKKGCQAIRGDAPRALASWLEEDNQLIINKFSLAALPEKSALLLTPDYLWKTYTSPTSAPAIKTLGSVTPTSRLYLDGALVDLGLRATFPLLRKKESLRRKVAVSLALDLEHNAYSSQKAAVPLTPQEILSLLRRCQNNACLTPLRSGK